MFPKRDAHGELTGILIAHVDDMLFTGAAEFRNEAIAAIRTFRTGELETLTKDPSVIFTGVVIESGPHDAILLPQQMYAGELPLSNISEYMMDKRIANLPG